MILPKQYEWLANELGPKMILEFLKVYGVKEVAGDGDNPTIIKWAEEVGLGKIFKHDATAWCGLVMALMAKRADKEIVKDPLWALNWAKWGIHTDEPMLGDILTFKRKGGGHVGLYLAEDADAFHVGGGNQGDAVSIARIIKTRLFEARRPQYIQMPGNVRRIFINAEGIISENEA